ncbi:MAG: alpha/beta hydrolase, partial [Gemmatimonadaceae bacterium]|nr:alpha/beta hydrolase [Gemmatimonadaceae bacterium]
MEQEEFTFGGKIRLTAVILLLLVSILILIPAPTYTLWKLEIGTNEWSTYLAIFALALLVPGWKRGRYSLISSLLALMVFCISALPLIRALEVGETLQADLESAFGPAVPRQIDGAPALIKPITLRLLLSNPAAPNVDVQTVNYASRVSGFLRMDLYKSTVLPAPRPVVIVVHGGSWNSGDRTDLPDLSYYLAARGYYVAAIDYRFAPQFKNPAQTEDLNDAIDYLKLHAGPLGVDPNRIALIGRSAGGHLVLLSAYTKHDPSIKGVV